MAGEANDAVSATQAHMSEALPLLRSPHKERPRLWRRLPLSRRPKQCHSTDEPVVLLKRNVNGHPSAGLLVEVIARMSTLSSRNCWEKYQLWECLYVHRKITTILVRMYGRYQHGWKERNIGPTRNIARKEIHLEGPTPLLNRVYVVCAQ